MTQKTPADTPQEVSDAWAQVAAKVEAYERDLAEAIYDVADETRRAVLTICRELGVEDRELAKARAEIDILTRLVVTLNAGEHLTIAERSILDTVLTRAEERRRSYERSP